MRTTITIYDELMKEIKKQAAEKGLSVKEVINAALKKGLEQFGNTSSKKKYSCPEYSLGEPKGYDLHKALRIVDSLESDEIIRKIHLRK